MKRFYDTCGLLNEMQKAFTSVDDKFYIACTTLKELENIKTSQNKDAELKYKARKLLHMLDEKQDFYEVILYSPIVHDAFISNFDLPRTDDSKIIAAASELNAQSEVIFYTADIACRMLAASVGLKVKSVQETEKEYTGFYEIVLTDEAMADFYSNKLPSCENFYELLENQYLIIKNSEGKIVDKYKYKSGKLEKVKFLSYNSTMFGKIAPKNGDAYQQLVLDSLENNQITMIRGAAGTGKSYLSFGYMFNKLEKGEIDKIIVFCNTVATLGSAKLGYYPGSKDEKLLDSQIGNLLVSKLGSRLIVEELIAKEKIVLLPMSDIRGYDTTGMRAAVYITEAQNLDVELMRLALQRIGEDSFCILDGDSDAQVDSSLYAGNNNGMRRVSEVFKGSDVYGEVTLQNIYRSKIAEIAQRM